MTKLSAEELRAGHKQVYIKRGNRLTLSYSEGRYHVELRGETVGSFPNAVQARDCFNREAKKLAKPQGRKSLF